MLPKYPITKYRPTKTSGDDGTFTEALGTGTTVYGIQRVHQGETDVILDRFEDVVVSDILVIDSKQYRVVGDLSTLGAPVKTFRVERVKKPIA